MQTWTVKDIAHCIKKNPWIKCINNADRKHKTDCQGNVPDQKKSPMMGSIL